MVDRISRISEAEIETRFNALAQAYKIKIHNLIDDLDDDVRACNSSAIRRVLDAQSSLDLGFSRGIIRVAEYNDFNDEIKRRADIFIDNCKRTWSNIFYTSFLYNN